MASFKVVQGNINCSVVVKPIEKYKSRKEELINSGIVKKVSKKRFAEADKKRKELLSVMSLLDCLESTTTSFDQADFFLNDPKLK